MNVNFGRAALAGIIGTVMMTVVGLYAAPVMGIPMMNPAEMLADQMGGNPLASRPRGRRGDRRMTGQLAVSQRS